MSHIINVSVKNHVAKQTDKTVYVCGNDDFVINFDFDSEWDQYGVKTARFTYGGNYVDVVFTGNTCAVPIITNVWRFKVGVFAGDLSTTTPVLISASKSILCETGTPAAPTDDVYNQIMEVVNEATTASNKAKASAEAVTPDDTTIDGKPWTSKQIVDTLCPEINETGNPVQCYPVKGYPLNVTASWEPTQEGSGDPSPDNIRPITGRDSVTITHNGTVHTLTLSETIYGGSVGSDGTGKNEWKTVKITGKETYADTATQSGKFVYRIKIKDNVNSIDLKASTLKALSNWAALTDYSVEFQSGQYLNLVVYVPEMNSKSDYVTWFTEHDTVIAYKLATPTTFTATGGTELTAVDGVNTVSTDADSVTVKGAEDPKHAIKELQDALASVTETEA